MRVIDRLQNTPIEQLHAFLIATTFFRFCVRRRLIDRSPLHAVELPGKFNERERVLTDDELKLVYRAAQNEPYPFGDIVVLCVLTGQRRGEVGKFRWEYIDQKERTITLPGSITKNGITHAFPYGPMVQTVLDGLPQTTGFLFPGRAYRHSTANDPQRHFEGWSRGKDNFDKRCHVDDWTLHDLRRTYRTIHAKIGTPPHIAERLVNHISISSKVSKIYDRYGYLPEMRKAVEAYEAHLTALLALKPVARAA
jgi:integrase